MFRMAYDPTFKHRNWWEYGLNPQDYKDYDYFRRPASVKEAIGRIENSGDISKPLITVHGTWDALIFSNVHAIPYERLVKEKKKGDIHRLYLIDKETTWIPWWAGRALIPKNHAAPFALRAPGLRPSGRLGGGRKIPPPSKTISKPQSEGKVYNL
jgi:hypothetical protein